MFDPQSFAGYLVLMIEQNLRRSLLQKFAMVDEMEEKTSGSPKAGDYKVREEENQSPKALKKGMVFGVVAMSHSLGGV